MTIRRLPEHIVARIAAGEVVERPASVVKELVENSLDADAEQIAVDVVEGGKKSIRVRDDGGGIPGDEVDVAFQRHATSKLATAEDLEHIATLGFRGEALASIAAVSRVTCITRSATESTGTRLRLEGGQIVHRATVGRPPGTEILVEDLFYNVPARRKFLRTERTERRHINGFLTRYAIAYPNVAFRVRHDGRETLSTPGIGDPREALVGVYGLELGGSLLEIPPELTVEQKIKVRGFVGPTGVHRANRGYITLMINGRWVEDLRISYAIIQAYHTLLPTKRYPVAFVMVEVPPEEVDVNVHPAKTEVRFRDGDEVFRAVQRAVRATVVEASPAAATWSPSRTPAARSEPTPRARLSALRPAQQFDFSGAERAAGVRTGPAEGEPEPTQKASADPDAESTQHRRSAGLPPLRIVGQIANTFIVAEGPDGLYLIDQHAAHERVLYEQLLARRVEGDVPAQPLLEPESVRLPDDEADRLEGWLPTLIHLGIEVEPFGPNTFLVRALPAPLRGISASTLLADIAAGDGKGSPVRTELEEQMVRLICKRAAVKGGQTLSTEEMRELVQALEQTRNPRTCPHGRPTILQISVQQLAAQFGRR
ncbi:MAG: DNA mismatch repair endonuclease MutL [Anaerolineae bacterium]